MIINSEKIRAIIDVGSNSVRLMKAVGNSCEYKKSAITKLARNMDKLDNLDRESVSRTVEAIALFKREADNFNAEEILVFATAAVRRAKNRDYFVGEVARLCGLSVDVVSGEEEAFLSATGALSGKDGAVIDVGGASSEVSVISSGRCIYTKSLDIGAVVLHDKFGENQADSFDFAYKTAKKLNVPQSTAFYAVGGTATSAAAILQELSPYDPTKTDGYVLTASALNGLKQRLFSMTVEERKNLKGLQPERAEVIASGTAVLSAIMKSLSIDSVIVSEKDNLEGYLLKISEKI